MVSASGAGMAQASELRFEAVQSPLVERMRAATRRMYSRGMVRVQPSGCVLPAGYRDHAQRIRRFPVRADDVWVVTYPKCGTTWTQEMVWLIMHDLDFEGAKKELLELRSPFLEYWAVCYPDEEKEFGLTDTMTYTEGVPSPRCIKSHLPRDLLPEQIWAHKCKIVYVTRSAKDVVVSCFYHHQLINGFSGTLDEFVEMFLAENVIYWDPFWKHILDFWKLKDDPNVLINTYEEMKRDLPSVIRRTAAFLGKSFSEEQVARLAEHLEFRNMKDNPAANYKKYTDRFREKFNVQHEFMRAGEAGAARRFLSPEQVQRIDAWSRQRLAGTDYPFVG